MRRGGLLHRAVLTGLILAGLLWVADPTVAGAQRPTRDPNAGCLIKCHGDPDFKEKVAPGQYHSLYIDYEAFQDSTHSAMLCVDCHTDVNVIPHPVRPQEIHCLQCHYQGNVVGAPVEQHPERYKASVHGKAREEGNPDAPDCGDCHGVHDVRPPEDPNSPVYGGNVPRTCGQCHIEAYTEYIESVHGTAVREGDLSAAVCTDCHQEHAIYPPSDPRSSINPKNVAQTCAHCHADQQLMRRENVSVQQVKTYQESFHGIAVKFGELRAANCTSCHNHHLILARNDTRSPIHPGNLDKTCGKCHPNATENVAKGRVHVIPSSPSAGIVFWVSQFFKWLTITVLAALFIHILLDLYGRLRAKWSEG